MKIVKTVLVVLTLALLGAMLAPGVRADEWNKKTVMTFSQPVEIPGQILPAGTYTFKLVDSASDRHIVQFFNADGTQGNRHSPGDQQLAASSDRQNRNQIRRKNRR